jgi:hypothetical protein
MNQLKKNKKNLKFNQSNVKYNLNLKFADKIPAYSRNPDKIRLPQIHSGTSLGDHYNTIPLNLNLSTPIADIRNSENNRRSNLNDKDPYSNFNIHRPRKLRKMSAVESESQKSVINKHFRQKNLNKQLSQMTIFNAQASYVSREYLASQNTIDTSDWKRSKSVLQNHALKMRNISVNKTLDKDLKSVMRVMTDSELKVKDIKFKNLFDQSQEEIKMKLQTRLDGITNIKPSHININLPAKFSAFIAEVTIWLRNAINQGEAINKKEFLKEFKLTESGEIFQSEKEQSKLSGYGMWITNKNDVIEAKFNDGKLMSGRTRILFANGEYYEGTVKLHGVKEGKGVYYYENGDVYDGEFVDNKRVSQSSLKVLISLGWEIETQV